MSCLAEILADRGGRLAASQTVIQNSTAGVTFTQSELTGTPPVEAVEAIVAEEPATEPSVISSRPAPGSSVERAVVAMATVSPVKMDTNGTASVGCSETDTVGSVYPTEIRALESRLTNCLIWTLSQMSLIVHVPPMLILRWT